MFFKDTIGSLRFHEGMRLDIAVEHDDHSFAADDKGSRQEELLLMD
jgi:hypothetical protein